MEHRADRPVLAIDLGGTQIRAALITPDLAVHARRAEPTRDEEGVDSVLARICEVAAEVLADAVSRDLEAPIGVAVASPGPLDPWSGIVLDPPNLASWKDVPLGATVATALDLPAFVERDTNVAAQAEWRYGAASGTSDMVYITVSTGIGGGAIIDGRPLAGPFGTAGEMGHIVVDLDGPRCGCGGWGHAEAIGSGTALARAGRELLERGGSPRLAELVPDPAVVDAELVARAAADGDPACGALLERAWVAIGAMCASIVNVLNPEVIVIGGGIAAHQPRLFEAARREVASRALPLLVDRVRIEPARLGADVSLIGGLPIVNERIGDPDFLGGSPGPRTVAAQQGAIHP